MATKLRSQNGWPAGPSAAALGIVVITIPDTDGVKIAVHRDVAPIAAYHGREWHRRVEKLHAGWCWGFAFRLIRGALTALSNHSSGTAWDWNAPLHALGKAHTLHGKADEVRRINAEIGIVRGGLEYQNRPDEMHTELKTGTTGAEVHVAATRLTKPATPPKDGGPTGPYPLRAGHLIGVRGPGASLVHDGDKSAKVAAAVRAVQREVGVAVTGHYGHPTKRAVEAWQRRYGLKVDGLVGPHTWKTMRAR